MTITRENLDRAASSAWPWREVEPGFWVGNEDGTFLGTVEVHAMRFFARDASRAYLGEYRSLSDACAAVARALTRGDR